MNPKSRVEFRDKRIFIDGAATQILSGAMHYFRIPREYWRDRLEKLRECGCNCTETYLCWNMHEPQEGQFNFEGNLDFPEYIRLAQELGLFVIVRPGPYICAEVDNGGLPLWLMAKPGLQFRCTNQVYLKTVKKYFAAIMPLLSPLQYDNGGPIIAMQIENEYASFGHDLKYLRTLRSYMQKEGATVPLFIADGGYEPYLADKKLEAAPLTLTFGSDGAKRFKLGQAIRPDDPPFCMEFWCGWFDHWGDAKHIVRDAEEVANEVDNMLAAGGSVNIYMFHGGTNFGLTSGANGLPGEKFQPTTTSYDYDAPLNEYGNPTAKYYAIQKVAAKHFGMKISSEKMPSRQVKHCKVQFSETALLYDNLEALSPTTTQSIMPLTFEALGCYGGLVNYRTRLAGPLTTPIKLFDVRDRAQLFLDEKHFFTYYRNDENNVTPEFTIPPEGMDLDVLVENMGHINFGPLCGQDAKGIIGGIVLFGSQMRMNWQHSAIPLNNLDKLDFKPGCQVHKHTPAFYRGTLEIAGKPEDIFLEFPGSKGMVMVNGINIGRYWNIGPGNALYLPAPFLKTGTNELIVLELEALTI